MVNLVVTFSLLGRRANAKIFEKQAMKTVLDMRGREVREMVASMSELAAVIYSRGQLRAAEKLELQVVEARQRLFGEEHPSTLTAMADLAVTISRRGKAKKAEKLKCAGLASGNKDLWTKASGYVDQYENPSVHVFS